jgi:hypothetical protein
LPQILIDANAYLDFYRLAKSQKVVLQLLESLADEIFVPWHVVNEVVRGRVGIVQEFFKAHLPEDMPSRLSGRYPLLEEGVPVDLVSPETAGKLEELRLKLKAGRTEMVSASQAIGSLSRDIRREVAGKVWAGDDVVSQALEKLWRSARLPTDEQVSRARIRKELGNPPGHKSNVLGDQLNWEQFLDAVGPGAVWIITNDSDFTVDVVGERRFSPLLHRELEAKLGGGNVQVRVIPRIEDGLNAFATTNKPEVALSEEDVKMVRDERDTLVSTDGLRRLNGLMRAVIARGSGGSFVERAANPGDATRTSGLRLFSLDGDPDRHAGFALISAVDALAIVDGKADMRAAMEAELAEFRRSQLLGNYWGLVVGATDVQRATLEGRLRTAPAHVGTWAFIPPLETILEQ